MAGVAKVFFLRFLTTFLFFVMGLLIGTLGISTGGGGSGSGSGSSSTISSFSTSLLLLCCSMMTGGSVTVTISGERGGGMGGEGGARGLRIIGGGIYALIGMMGESISGWED